MNKIESLIEKLPRDKKIFLFIKGLGEFIYIVFIKNFYNGIQDIIGYGNNQKVRENKGHNYYINLLIVLSLIIYLIIILFGTYGTFKYFNNISFDKSLVVKNEINDFFTNSTKLIKNGECEIVANMERAYIESDESTKKQWIETCNNTLKNRIYSYDLLIQKIFDIEDYKRTKVSLFEIEDKYDSGVIKTFYWQRTFYLDKKEGKWIIMNATKNLIASKESLFK